MENIFCNLPNNLIMKIIKIAEDERAIQEQTDMNKYLFLSCIYELKSFAEYTDTEEDGYIIDTGYIYDRPVKYLLSRAKGKYISSNSFDAFDYSSEEEYDY